MDGEKDRIFLRSRYPHVKKAKASQVFFLYGYFRLKSLTKIPKSDAVIIMNQFTCQTSQN